MTRGSILKTFSATILFCFSSALHAYKLILFELRKHISFEIAFGFKLFSERGRRFFLAQIVVADGQNSEAANLIYSYQCCRCVGQVASRQETTP
jgi:hypothetical protein